VIGRAVLAGVTAAVVAFAALWAVAPLLAGEPVIPEPAPGVNRSATGCVVGALAI